LPELALHFSVPFAIAAPRMGIKRALLISLVALLPDLDALFRIHRFMSHSALVLILAYAPVLLIARGLKPEHFRLALAGFLALLSHPFMDCFQTYTPILYPLASRSIWINAKGSLLISREGLVPQASAAVRGTPTAFKAFEAMDAPIFTSDGLPISILLMALPLILALIPPRPAHPRGRPAGGDCAPEPPAPPIAPQDLTVVLPVLNEEEAIGEVLDELKGEGYENVLVVDGYSKDGTARIAGEKGARVVFQRGSGKAGAIATAIELVETPYMVVMDGDHTYDPKDIRRLLLQADGRDEVIGARADRGNIPPLHRLGNRIISSAFNFLLGAGLSDVCSGMYLLRTDSIKGIELRCRGFSAEVEIAAIMHTLGRATEVPISYRARIGRAKLGAWRGGFEILRAVIWLARAYNPAFLFASLASLLAIPGIAITLWELYLRYVYGAEAWSFGMAWLGLFLLIVGIQGFSVATMSLMLKRMERRISQALRGRAGPGAGP
jgi:dolichol-phosphate mannosyltransferase